MRTAEEWDRLLGHGGDDGGEWLSPDSKTNWHMVDVARAIQADALIGAANVCMDRAEKWEAESKEDAFVLRALEATSCAKAVRELIFAELLPKEHP